MDEAKITGITPAVLIFKGKWELWPPYILFPTCLLGYWTGNLLCPFSTKTINIISKSIRIKIPKIKAILNSPVLPNWRVLTKALGKLAIIPAVIINEIPFPTPLEEICSPNHIRKTVPPTSVITVVSLKKIPGSKTILP